MLSEGVLLAELFGLEQDLLDGLLEFFPVGWGVGVVGLDDFVQADLTWVGHEVLLSSRMLRSELQLTWQISSTILSILAQSSSLSSCSASIDPTLPS